MLPYPTIILISIAALVLMVVIVYVSSGSFLAVVVVLLLGSLLLYLLSQFGVLTIEDKNGQLEIDFHETIPQPKSQLAPEAPTVKQEVFHVSGNNYQYEEASALCAAYESALATYDQVVEAYTGGAEWCEYGWTQGGMALFPTQDTTWAALQQEISESGRTACGRPGVNGGYMDPSTKLGVNCYGVKPKSPHGEKFPLPLPGTDNSKFNSMVNKFRSMLKKIMVSPFNRQGWSEWNLTSHE